MGTRISVHHMAKQHNLILKQLAPLMTQNTIDNKQQHRQCHACMFGLLAVSADIFQPLHRATHKHRHNASHGQILIAVGNKRKLHKAEWQKAQGRGQRDGKKQGPGERPTPKPLTGKIQTRSKSHCRHKWQPVHKLLRTHIPTRIPTRIDKQQGFRPQQFARIKPQSLSGDKQPHGEGMLHLNNPGCSITAKSISPQQ